jgi:2-polyprenyl-6-methoxyphenol hydroxylase-like FAD-dependent oxidoreductase
MTTAVLCAFSNMEGVHHERYYSNDAGQVRSHVADGAHELDDELSRLPEDAPLDSCYDVVVVGARDAGAATAMLLARAGAHVLVVDRAVAGRDTSPTHALTRAGVVQLHRWGLLDRVVAAGTPAVRRTEVHHGDACTVVTLKPVAGVDALYAPRRSVLDAILLDGARAAGAHVCDGVDVQTVTTSPDGRVTGVAGHRADGSEFRVHARFTVGADGLQSRIARAVRAPVERQGRHASGVVYGHVTGLATDRFEWHYAPGLTAGVVPTNDGEACVWAGASMPRFLAELADDVAAGLTRLLREVSPELAERFAATSGSGPIRGHASVPGVVRRPWGPGWALVGDAGSYLDPCTAHSVSDALRDAELLTRALTAVLDGANTDVALGQFHRTRDALSHRRFGVTDEIASYRWDTDTVAPLLRSLTSATSDEVDLLTSLDAPPGRKHGGAGPRR